MAGLVNKNGPSKYGSVSVPGLGSVSGDRPRTFLFFKLNVFNQDFLDYF